MLYCMLTTIMRALGMYRETVSRDCMITGKNFEFWNFLGERAPETTFDLFDVFPELVGRETEISCLLSSVGGVLRLPAVRHGEVCFNLSVLSPPVGFECGLIILQDISNDLVHHHAVLQKRNELVFLNRQIELRNAELAEAGQKLDRIMNMLRDESHALNLEVLRQTRELHDSRLCAINTLAQAAEFREQETGGHLYRIGRSCVLIGKKLGMERSALETLFYACLLHDVGKIGIPDSILLKPGSLDEDEWDIMRRHTSIGAALLSKNRHKLFDAARDVALSHHEKWDGTGYPEGISGYSIPLMARICAVADVYDALVSERIYKKAWLPDDAVRTIIRESGTRFDPAVVSAFIAVYPEIHQLEKHSDEEIDELEPEFDT